MHVRLSAPWTDPDGTVRAPGETVDVDAVTLAKLEEQGMVEEPDGQGTGSGKTTTSTTTTPSKETDPQKIGPGPGAPPADDKTN